MEQSKRLEQAKVWAFVHGAHFQISLGRMVLLLIAAVVMGAAMGVGEGGVWARAVPVVSMAALGGTILRRAYMRPDSGGPE